MIFLAGVSFYASFGLSNVEMCVCVKGDCGGMCLMCLMFRGVLYWLWCI